MNTSHMRERWRAFFDGYYEVSDMGRIRRAKPGVATFVGRPVQPVSGPGGYPQVQVCGGGKIRRMYLHHIVAETFHGPRPRGFVINHKDLDKSNNAASNLEYLSSRDNAMHALAVGRRRKGPMMSPRPLKGGPQFGDAHWSRRRPDLIARGERMGGSKLKARDVRRIRSFRASGWTMQKIADRFGVSLAQISRIIGGTRWSHIK